jgi:hypothetical protein
VTNFKILFQNQQDSGIKQIITENGKLLEYSAEALFPMETAGLLLTPVDWMVMLE